MLDRKIKYLGKGSFGQVILVQNKADGKYYAMKQTELNGGRMRADQNAEYLILTQFASQFRSPFIVRLYDTLFDSSYCRLFVDYCAGGSLRERIVYRKAAHRPFTENVFNFLFESIHTFLTISASNCPACRTHTWCGRFASSQHYSQRFKTGKRNARRYWPRQD